MTALISRIKEIYYLNSVSTLLPLPLNKPYSGQWTFSIKVQFNGLVVYWC